MEMSMFKMFVLFVTISVATSENFNVEEFSERDLNQIQKIIQDVESHGYDTNSRVRHLHPHHYEANNEHDHTNIQTLNLVFKHNNIGRSKPIARLGEREDHNSAVDGSCLLGRCGCGGKSSRCGCGRNGDPCEVNRDYYTKDNTYVLGKNYNDVDPSDDRKNRANDDANIKQFLNDLENVLSNDKQASSVGYPKQDCKGPNCRAITWDYTDYNDKTDKGDENIIKFLDDLENALTKGKNVAEVIDNERDDDDNDEDDDNSYLRCFKRCGKKNSYRTIDGEPNKEDDRAYLRCCKRCGKSKIFRSINRDSDENNKEDDRLYLRCCKKKCGKSKYIRMNGDPFNDEGHREYLRCCRNCGRSDDPELNFEDMHNRAAKIYQINDDLDAIVIDVSDIDNILKLVNNGNNLDNSNTIRDYIRASHTKLVPKHQITEVQKRQSRLLPMTLQQKLKLKNDNRYIRRNQKPDVEKHGLPFQLDVQGLGQVNP